MNKLTDESKAEIRNLVEGDYWTNSDEDIRLRWLAQDLLAALEAAEEELEQWRSGRRKISGYDESLLLDAFDVDSIEELWDGEE